MTPAARYAAAIDVLDAWVSGTPVEQALSRWARGARYAGSKDRAAVRDHVFDVLRARQSCARLGGGGSGRALILGLLCRDGLDPAVVFTGEGHAPAALSGDEAAQAGDEPPDPAEDIPDWLRAPLTARVGAARARELFAAFQTRAPLWLRVNLRRASRADAAARLAEDGLTTRADPACPTAVQVTGGARALRRASAYLDGWVEPQDLSVQRALQAIDWPRSGRILDYCAGGGGKALALADRGDARIFAHDANPRRMADLPARAARAGVTIPTLGTDALAGAAPFQAVLCDVPCSGSGIWRRDPEAKWRLTPADLDRLTATQDAILDAAAPLVAPGGLLVYMTCSLLAAENEDRIGAFLARAPGWRVVAQGCATPLDASDGFFHAVLIREAAAG